MGWGKCDGEKRWQPHNARGQMITERTTCSHDFIYTVHDFIYTVHDFICSIHQTPRIVALSTIVAWRIRYQI